MDSVYFPPVGEKLRNDPLQGFCAAFLTELRVICEEFSGLRNGVGGVDDYNYFLRLAKKT